MSTGDNGPARVAYVMSRFPKLTETFILFEMLAVERQGVDVEVYPLLRERTAVMHPQAPAVVARARFLPFLSWPVVRSQLHFLRTAPRTYLRTVWALLRGTWGSLNFFVGALGILPKTVHAARLMAAAGVTHVHCHFASHPAAAGFVIQRLTGIPFSFTAHGSDLHVDRTMLPQKVAEAAFVVAVSEYNRELIVSDCGEQVRDKVHVIHCGVDTGVFRPPAVRAATERFTVACVATLLEVKGQTFLVHACRRLVAEGIDVVCRLVGDGPDRELLRRRITEAGLADRVLLCGRLPREAVAQLLADADVLVAPSVPTRRGKREGIPIALMEAMSTGVPVVASDISGIPELVAHGVSGLLVPPGDAEALAGALRRLHENAGLGRLLAHGGRQKVLAEIDQDRNAAALVERFERATVT